MINVFQAVKKYDLGSPFVEAAAELALHTESGTFMKRGHYKIVSVGSRYVFPEAKLEFMSDLGVAVTAGDNYVVFQTEKERHILWRTEALNDEAA